MHATVNMRSICSSENPTSSDMWRQWPWSRIAADIAIGMSAEHTSYSIHTVNVTAMVQYCNLLGGDVFTRHRYWREFYSWTVKYYCSSYLILIQVHICIWLHTCFSYSCIQFSSCNWGLYFKHLSLRQSNLLCAAIVGASRLLVLLEERLSL